MEKMEFLDDLSDYQTTVEEFAHFQKEGKPYTLLDVRQEWEVEKAHIEPYIHIPLEDLIENIHKIPHNDPVIVICHHGVRSLRACFLLRKSGFDNVKSLQGGIEQWSQKIDPSVPRYTKV